MSEPLIKRLEKLEEENTTKKNKKFRFPSKAKVRGSKMKKGYLGVLRVDENQLGTFTKVPIEGRAFEFNQNEYHATDGREIIMINGKYPLIIVPSWRRNPIQIRKDEDINETYGDNYVKAKLLKDAIKVKKPASGGLIVILIIGAVFFVLGKFVFKWF